LTCANAVRSFVLAIGVRQLLQELKRTRLRSDEHVSYHRHYLLLRLRNVQCRVRMSIALNSEHCNSVWVSILLFVSRDIVVLARLVDNQTRIRVQYWLSIQELFKIVGIDIVVMGSAGRDAKVQHSSSQLTLALRSQGNFPSNQTQIDGPQNHVVRQVIVRFSSFSFCGFCATAN
jgi:hypothetical protein